MQSKFSSPTLGLDKAFFQSPVKVQIVHKAADLQYSEMLSSVLPLEAGCCEPFAASFPRELEPPCALQRTCTLMAAQ